MNGIVWDINMDKQENYCEYYGKHGRKSIGDHGTIECTILKFSGDYCIFFSMFFFASYRRKWRESKVLCTTTRFDVVDMADLVFLVFKIGK